MQPAPYTIYAVQYAQRNTNSSELFVGDHHNTPMKMAQDHMFYLGTVDIQQRQTLGRTA
jgi:hypothetical protein